VSKYLSVPVAAVVVWLLIVQSQLQSRRAHLSCRQYVFLAYIAAGVLRTRLAGSRPRAGDPTIQLDAGI